MSDKLDEALEAVNIACKQLDIILTILRQAHKPEPNESVSSARTRGSLTAPHGQSESETTAPQLAPFSARAGCDNIRAAMGCKRIPCGRCVSYDECYPSPYGR